MKRKRTIAALSVVVASTAFAQPPKDIVANASYITTDPAVFARDRPFVATAQFKMDDPSNALCGNKHLSLQVFPYNENENPAYDEPGAPRTAIVVAPAVIPPPNGEATVEFSPITVPNETTITGGATVPASERLHVVVFFHCVIDEIGLQTPQIRWLPLAEATFTHQCSRRLWWQVCGYRAD